MKNKTKKAYTTVNSKKKKKKGMALILILIVFVILLILGSSLLQMGLQARMLSIKTNHEIVARAAADSGLTKAFYEMNEKLKVKPWDNQTLPAAIDESLPFTDAFFSYNITENTNFPYGYNIEAIGKCQGFVKKIYGNLQIENKYFQLPLFIQSGLYAENNVVIDGYDAANGLYGPDNSNLNTSVITNSTTENTIYFTNSATLNGDLTVGPGGDPAEIIDGTGNITGNISAAEELTELIIPEAPALIYRGSNPTGTITQSGRYDNLILSNSENLIINSNITLHITGELIVQNLASLQINEGASLKLFINQNFELKNNGRINNLTKIPSNLEIYSCSAYPVDYVISNAGIFYGYIYAPKANMVVQNNANFFGAIIVDNLLIQNGTEIHCDEQSKKTSEDSYSACFVINRWQEN